MRRAIVVGSPGAGKSAFSKRLAERTGLPLVHLDEAYWLPEWTRRHTPEGWRAEVERLVAREAWILDGNYPSTLELRVARADHAIVLATPRPVCLYRALTRAWFGRRPDGDVLRREPVSRGFLTAIWRGPHQTRREIERLRAFEGLTLYVLRSSRDADVFIEGLRKAGHRETPEPRIGP